MSEQNRPSRRRLPEPVWPVLGLVLAWGILISQVRHHWGGESYYNFGWFVPVLAIWLLLRNFAPLERHPSGRLRGHIAWASLLMLALIPFHALSEVNPFWRLPLWIQAVGLVAYTWVVIHSLYGWKGVIASVFPLFFLSTMIPWPYRIELWIVQSLTGVVVVLAVEGLHFLGFPVEIAGNSLILDDLSIGVNEACSGIRSLQALFMVTLFLGSLFGQSAVRRTGAVLLLPFIVIVVNATRAMFLSIQVIVNGDAAYEAWHDPAGYIAFGVSMVLIYACIELLNIGSGATEQSQSIQFGPLIYTWQDTRTRPSMLAFVVLPLFLYGTVEGWFLYHEATSPPGNNWTFSLPEENGETTQYAEIHTQVEVALGYNYGYRFFHALSRERWVEVYYYGYKEEDKLASVSSYGHSPAICMESIGATMLEQFPDLMLQIGQLTIPVKHYLFELKRNETKRHVFWIIWEHRNMNIDPEHLKSLNYRTQWIQLLQGRRDFSRQVVLTSLTGIENTELARESITDLLTEWVVPADD